MGDKEFCIPLSSPYSFSEIDSNYSFFILFQVNFFIFLLLFLFSVKVLKCAVMITVSL